jgi:hypothetical protein
VRLLQALIDVAADRGLLGTALATMNVVQALMQACSATATMSVAAAAHLQTPTYMPQRW